MNKLRDKILGSMIGGAVGDALGYPVEFMSYSQIVAKYGPKGITRYELNSNGVAEISDDTQMTLYTANGLIIDDIKTAYLEWYHTQNSVNTPHAETKCWISKNTGLYSCRAPGMTCLSALSAIEAGTDAHNNSKGCGGIMRVAPIALWGCSKGIDVSDSVDTAIAAAKLTHKHLMGWLPAGVMVYVIQEIIQSGAQTTQAIIEILKGLPSVYQRYPHINPESICQFDKQMSDVVDLAINQDIADEAAIRKIGEGWTGDEAWLISLYCVLRHIDSFEDAVIAAVNHSGDSDSTGAITGNIMGAIHGYDAIPDYYKQDLELRDVIETMANELYAGSESA